MKIIILFSLLSLFTYGNNLFEKEISIETINSISHEYVYDPNNLDYKLSELIWETEDISMLAIKLSYTLKGDLFIKFDGKINISSEAKMDDYDWLKGDQTQWSDWSTHPNTIVDKYNIIDLSLNRRLDTRFNIEQNINIGFKYDDKRYKAYDGSYIYSSQDGFRDQFGTFSGLGITYSEQFSSIYVGIDGKLKLNSLIVKAALKYSPFVNITNSDTHHLRYFTNENSFDTTSMVNIEASVLYPIEENIFFGLIFESLNYSKTDGVTTRTYYSGATEAEAGSVYKYNGAAIQSSYEVFNLALMVKF